MTKLDKKILINYLTQLEDMGDVIKEMKEHAHDAAQSHHLLKMETAIANARLAARTILMIH